MKVRDPCLHQSNIAVPGFLVVSPAPEGVQQVELPSQRTAKEEATPSKPALEEAKQVVKVSDSKDDFEIFNQP